MKKITLWSIVAIVIALAVGATIHVILVKTKPTQPKKEAPIEPLVVHTQTLSPEDIVETLVGYGTAQADDYAQVSAQVSGKVVYVSPKLETGTAVGRDEIVVRVDDRDYQEQLKRAQNLRESTKAAIEIVETNEASLKLQLESATAELEIARRDLKRVQELYDTGSAGTRELDAAKGTVETRTRVYQELKRQYDQLPETLRQTQSQLKINEADVALATLNLERCEIKTPFDGQIDLVPISEGELVAPGTPVFSILDPNIVEIPIEIPASWYPRISPNAQCQLSMEASPAAVWVGRISRVSPTATPTTRTISLFVTVDNRQQTTPLKPGIFLRAKIEGETMANAFCVPRQAVIRGNTIFVADQDVADERKITVVRNVQDRCVISGVSEGEIVITSHLDSITDGTPIVAEETVTP